MTLSEIFENSQDDFLKAKIHVEPKLDYESTMQYIFKQWVDELTKDGDYPKDVLIPVKMEDIKKSSLPQYTQYIEEAYRKANVKGINDLFKDI